MLMLIILGAITIFIGAAAVALLVGGRNKENQRLMEVIASSQPSVLVEEPRDRVSGIVDLLKPVTNLFGANHEDLSHRLVLAGYRSESVPHIFFASRLLLPLLLVLIVTFSVSDDPWVPIMMAGALGFFAPDIWLNWAVAKRRNKIAQGLPDAIDLLVICMEAGLGMDQALIRVGKELQVSHRDLSYELTTIHREQRAGKPRVDAWRSMAERIDLDVIRQLVAMLVQTERFGTPVAKSLGQFSESLRVQRMQKIEELAAKTTVKMIFPLVLFIFPSMFVVLLGPAVINIMRNLANLG
jgi:tight adherence protein C